MRQKVMVVSEADAKIWELVSDVPKVGKPMAVVVTILNFMIPGLGTILATCYD